MRPIRSFPLLFSLLCGTVPAQGPYPNRCHRQDAIERLYQESLSNAAVWSQETTEMVKQMEARHKEMQFWLKANRFVQTWTLLAREYNDRGAFNVKQARAASKAFHDLEKTEGWPK
jgi:hypothetical protein